MSAHKYTREEFMTWPDDRLRTYSQMRFVWLDSVPRTERDEFYVLQGIAEEILAERRLTLPLTSDDPPDVRASDHQDTKPGPT
jgi:hypothetical protein